MRTLKFCVFVSVEPRVGHSVKLKPLCRICPVYLLDDKSGDVPVGDALIVGHKVGVFPDLTKAAEKIVKIKVPLPRI